MKKLIQYTKIALLTIILAEEVRKASDRSSKKFIVNKNFLNSILENDSFLQSFEEQNKSQSR